MRHKKDVKLHDKIAKEYDALAKKSESHIHEIIFEMYTEYINPADSLLDIGIGTGLSSELFAKAGLIIYGLDNSKEMLKECAKKEFTKEIKQYDIQNVPFPYADNSFSHVISCGLLHIFRDFEPFVKEVRRILKPGGTFAFSIISLTADDSNCISDYIEVESNWKTLYYKHSDKYIKRMAEEFSFSIKKEKNTFSKSEDENAQDYLLKIIVMQK